MSKLEDVLRKEKRMSKFIDEMASSVGNEESVESLISDSNQSKILEYLSYIGVSDEYLEVPAVVEITKERMKEILKDENSKVGYTGLKGKSLYMQAQKNGSIKFSDDKYFKSPRVYINSDSIIYESVRIDKYGAIESKSSSGIGGDYSSSERNSNGENNLITSENTDGASYEDMDEYQDSGNPFSLMKMEDTTEDSVIKNYERSASLYPSILPWFYAKYPERFKDFQNIDSRNLGKSKAEVDDEEITQTPEEQRNEIIQMYFNLKEESINKKTQNTSTKLKLLFMYKNMSELEKKSNTSINSSLLRKIQTIISPLIDEEKEVEEDAELQEKENRRPRKSLKDMSDDELIEKFENAKKEVSLEGAEELNMRELIKSTRYTITHLTDIAAREEKRQLEKDKQSQTLRSKIKNVLGKSRDD